MTSLEKPLVVGGWSVYFLPMFLDQCEALVRKVESLRSKDPRGYKKKSSTKRLAAIAQLTLEIIPQNPARVEYRQGGTLGDRRKHWFRAKFYQQYRLFFRFHAAERIIVYAWVNDDDTKRAYESSDDAYRVFGKMLDSGDPPDDWDELFAQARKAPGRARKLLREQ